MKFDLSVFTGDDECIYLFFFFFYRQCWFALFLVFSRTLFLISYIFCINVKYYSFVTQREGGGGG